MKNLDDKSKEETLTKAYVDTRLGESVSIDNGRMNGAIGYEHNTGRLAIYASHDDHFLGFLNAGNKVTFTKESATFIFPKEGIRE